MSPLGGAIGLLLYFTPKYVRIAPIMGLNTLEMQYGAKAAPYIAEAGGKIGGLNFLKATVPSLKDAILPVQVVNPDESLGELKVPEGDQGQYIIRGSHPMDFQGIS